jgi:cell wall-associated NlpC family hydrolase
MTMTREQLVVETRSWIATTPYKKRGIKKGVGVDCGSFIGCVWVNAGIIPPDDLQNTMKEIQSLSDDWFLHAANENYVDLLSRYAEKIGEQKTFPDLKIAPGNVILMQTRHSERQNHGAIVVAWPRVVHCIYTGIFEVDASRDPMWAYKSVMIFDPWKKNEGLKQC